MHAIYVCLYMCLALPRHWESIHGPGRLHLKILPPRGQVPPEEMMKFAQEFFSRDIINAALVAFFPFPLIFICNLFI